MRVATAEHSALRMDLQGGLVAPRMRAAIAAQRILLREP